MGKSTLVNRLVGERVAIVSDKAQTTRHRIMGVLHRPGAQVVLLDTPGMHRPRHRLGEWMLKVAHRSLSDADLAIFVVDGSYPRPGAGDLRVASQLAVAKTPTIMVVNKIDQVPPTAVPAVVAAYEPLGNFIAVIPASALTGVGVDQVETVILSRLQPGPAYFPADVYTDQPERVLAGELIREQVLHLTREEIPHAVSVEVQEMILRPNGKTYVSAAIYVERESQKGILIGRGGGLLREIGTRARREIEPLLGTPVYLDLWVKVKADWRNREGSLRSLGYDQG